MATGLLSQYIAAHGPAGYNPDVDPKVKQAWAFQQRVKVAIVAAAIAVAAEATTTPGHANRAAFAQAVLRTPELYAGAFALALASQALDESNTDSDITTAVANVWNAFSG